jgi:hypothetical protein
MKKTQALFLLGFILLINSAAKASFYLTDEASKSYQFKFKFQKNENSQPQYYEVSLSSTSQDEAYAAAAEKCYVHFRDLQPRINLSVGQDIINACANPVRNL